MTDERRTGLGYRKCAGIGQRSKRKATGMEGISLCSCSREGAWLLGEARVTVDEGWGAGLKVELDMWACLEDWR